MVARNGLFPVRSQSATSGVHRARLGQSTVLTRHLPPHPALAAPLHRARPTRSLRPTE